MRLALDFGAACLPRRVDGWFPASFPTKRDVSKTPWVTTKDAATAAREPRAEQRQPVLRRKRCLRRRAVRRMCRARTNERAVLVVVPVLRGSLECVIAELTRGTDPLFRKKTPQLKPSTDYLKLQRDPDNRLQSVPVHILHGEGRTVSRSPLYCTIWIGNFDRWNANVLQKRALRIRNAGVGWVVAGRSATVPRRHHRSERRTSK